MKLTRLIARCGYEYFSKHLPASTSPGFGTLCRAVRYWFICILAVECGKRVNLEHGATVSFSSGIRIGDYSGLGIDCVVESPLIMGANINMGPEVVIYRSKHHGYARTDIPMRTQKSIDPSPLFICDDVWIGRRAMILPSCTKIGRGAIVGAGAVVTHDVADYSIVAGNPAREVNKRQLTHDPTDEARLTLPSGVIMLQGI